MAKQKDYTDEFLNEFKKVEQVIQQVYGSDKTFRDVEMMMDEKGNTDISKPMQVCRIIRNYASHNADSHLIIPVPEETYKYLQKLNAMFSSEIQKAKDLMSRTKAMTKNDDLAYAAQRLSKMPEVPVIDDNGILKGTFTKDVLCKCVADGVTPKTKISKDVIKLQPIQMCACVSSNDAATDIIETFRTHNLATMYVTNDGTPAGKYIGTIIDAF